MAKKHFKDLFLDDESSSESKSSSGSESSESSLAAPKEILFVSHMIRTLLNDDKRQLVIFNPPVNSSGDVYHYLGWLGLCVLKGWVVPDIVLAYDNDRTETQVDRALDLARFLGLDQHLEFKDFIGEIGSTQSPPRHAATRRACRSSLTVVMDQKVTTLFLSLYAISKGYENFSKEMTQVFIAPILKCIAKAAEEEEELSFEKSVNKEVKKALKKAEGKKILLINHRTSDAANANQSLSIEDLRFIVKVAQDRGFHVHALIAGDGSDGATAWLKKRKGVSSCYVFPSSVEGEYQKAHHMYLLHSLKPHVVGIVGGTSGTLDIAAFIGLKTYSLHEFKADIKEQDYRLLMQIGFMSMGIVFSSADMSPIQRCINQQRFIAWVMTQATMSPALRTNGQFKWSHKDRNWLNHALCGGDLSEAVSQQSICHNDAGTVEYRVPIFPPKGHLGLHEELRKAERMPDVTEITNEEDMCEMMERLDL